MLDNIYFRESNLIEGFDSPVADNCLFNAWQYLCKFLHTDLTKDIICETLFLTTAHQTELSSFHRNNYRIVPVTVGYRVCPRPYMVIELMNNWLLDMKQNWKNLEPKKMHVRFEKIHPFIDGNGRTGRLLMWWHEEKLERKPTLILNSEKQKYYEWFR